MKKKTIVLVEYLVWQIKIKEKLFDTWFKNKSIKQKIILKNLNHYRDFISLEDISKIIIMLLKKYGGSNIGTGKGTYLGYI